MNSQQIRRLFGVLAENPGKALSILDDGEAGAYDDPDDGGDGGGADPDDDPDDVQADDPDDDDVVPVTAMDVDLEAAATGRLSMSSDAELDGTISASADNPRQLTGIIWGSGEHNLGLNGNPAGVFVPDGETAVQVNGASVVFDDTIEPTFRQLKRDIEAAETKTPTVGFDHPENSSVAALAGIVDLGPMKDVALSADKRNIVLTDSELENAQAIEANRRGDLEKFDFSIVAKVAKKRDEDGDVVRTDDGRIVLAGTRIERADIVIDGAVDAASVGAMPKLAADIAATDASPGADAFVASAFRAEAAKHESVTMEDLDPEDFETVEAAFSAVGDRIEEKDSRIEDLEAQAEANEAKADAFETIAEADDVDVDDYDDVTEAAQAVVDARTKPLRQQIAATEAELPSHDVGTDNGPTQEARVEELAGSSVAELKMRRGDLATEALRASNKKESFGTAIAAGETAGAVGDLANGGSGGSGSDADVDARAESVLAPSELMEAEKSEQSPGEYIQAEHGVDPADYDSENALSAAIRGN